MTTQEPAFPPLSPRMASERFLIRDDQWDQRFKPDFDQFIAVPIEFARPIIKLPVPPARTNNHALFLLTGGALNLSTGQDTMKLEPRCLAVIPAMQIFSITDIRPDAAGFMCFFSRETLANATHNAAYLFLRLTSQPMTRLSEGQTQLLVTLLGRLSAEYSEFGSTQTDIIWPYLHATLAEINRIYAGTSPNKTDAGDRLVQGFIDLINTSSQQNNSVAWYADQLNVSPNHLNKVIRSRTGQSPSVWIDKRLVLEAKVMLYQSTLSIGQIATELGFSDQTTFGKLFRRYEGVSPSVFRKKIDSDEPLPGSA